MLSRAVFEIFGAPFELMKQEVDKRMADRRDARARAHSLRRYAPEIMGVCAAAAIGVCLALGLAGCAAAPTPPPITFSAPQGGDPVQAAIHAPNAVATLGRMSPAEVAAVATRWGMSPAEVAAALAWARAHPAEVAAEDAAVAAAEEAAVASGDLRESIAADEATVAQERAVDAAEEAADDDAMRPRMDDYHYPPPEVVAPAPADAYTTFVPSVPRFDYPALKPLGMPTPVPSFTGTGVMIPNPTE